MIQFFSNDLHGISEMEQDKIFHNVEQKLKSKLWDGAQWIADYRRLRIVAKKENAKQLS